MADPDGSLITLDRLRHLGVSIFIDDFGSGYGICRSTKSMSTNPS